MAQDDDQELRVLRKMVYGPDADIHLSPQVVDRLRELEGTARQQALHAPEALLPSPEFSDAPPVAPIDELPEPAPEKPSRARELLRRLSHVRRSAVLVALSVVVVAAILATALTLIQRVQADPLQVGATQVARLKPTNAYPAPVVFGGDGAGSSSQAQSYQAFYGLHAVVSTTGGALRTNANGFCLTVYTAATVTDPTSGSFTGQFMRGCAAGKFPAMVQFTMGVEGFPAALRSKYGKATSFQFVYDEVHHEVVIFTDR
ncbi:MAG: hypothetical protein ABI400_08355 [Lacisediminihabitans sp.]